jgi:hypothetical protein
LLNVTKGLTGKRRRRKGARGSVSTQAVDQLERGGTGTVNRGRAKNGSLRLRGEANQTQECGNTKGFRYPRVNLDTNFQHRGSKKVNRKANFLARLNGKLAAASRL